MTPRFKEGDFNRGVADGMQAVIAVLEGDTSLLSQSAEVSVLDNRGLIEESFSDSDLSWPERILMGGFIFGIIGLFTGIALIMPGAGWFLYFFLIPFWATFPAIVIGVNGTLWAFGIYLVGFPILKLFIRRLDWYKKASHDLKTKGSADFGSWTLGSRSSSGSSRSSSGGFSGGGGRSGGGGASGSW
jgi:uncharacterized protein